MRRCIGPFAIDVTFIMTYQRVKSKKGEIKKLRHNYKKNRTTQTTLLSYIIIVSSNIVLVVLLLFYLVAFSF